MPIKLLTLGIALVSTAQNVDTPNFPSAKEYFLKSAAEISKNTYTLH